MAQLAVIVMCPSERPPPLPVRRLASSATKSLTTQNYDYVPGHISCELQESVASKACSAPGVGVGLMKLEKTG
jgi:hypothetical protein